MAILTAAGLMKAYAGVQAVGGVDIRVATGEILGLIGPNGAGKTTLFNLLSGTAKADAGSVEFRNVDVTRWPVHKRVRAGLTRTFQIARPFPGITVLENVAIGAMFRAGSMGAALAEARRVLDRVHLGDQADRLAATLTEGDRKRLEIGKAIATGPTLLLLDEVLAGLTATDVGQVLELIREVRDEGVTVILIEHNVKAVLAVADRVVVLNLGKVLMKGLPDEVASDRRVVDVYLGKDGHRAAP